MSSKNSSKIADQNQSNSAENGNTLEGSGRGKRKLTSIKPLFPNDVVKQKRSYVFKNGPAKKRKECDNMESDGTVAKKRDENFDLSNLSYLVDDNIKAEDLYQMFEKPLKIYEYLSLRHKYQPIYLNRNLSYLKPEKIQSARKVIKKNRLIDSVCNELTLKHYSNKQQQQLQQIKELTINFLSFQLKTATQILNEKILKAKKQRKSKTTPSKLEKADEKAHIELYALDNQNEEHLLGKCVVCVFESDEEFTNKHDNNEDYNKILNGLNDSNMKICLNGHSNKHNSKLRINLIFKTRLLYTSYFNLNLNEILNDCSHANAPIYTIQMTRIYNGNDDDDEQQIIDEQNNEKKNLEFLKNKFHSIKSQIKFRIEVKLAAQQPQQYHNTRKQRLNNSSNSITRFNDSIITISSSSSNNSSFHTPNCSPQKPLMTKNLRPIHKLQIYTNGSFIDDFKVAYQFVYGNKNNVNSNTSNKKLPKINTFSNEPYKCPFCYLNCKFLGALLKHFTFVHFRFNVECIPTQVTKSSNGKIQINISLNDLFNGSYAGNQYDLHSPYGFSFSRTQPFKRIPITYIYVSKKSNFLYSTDINDLNGSNQMQFNNLYNINSLEKLYYHTRTCSPIKQNELLESNECFDSDNEIDPEWLKEQTELFIHEFTDVNQGEKEIMRLWNLHVMNNILISDAHIYNACETFLNLNAKYIIENNLCKNFLLHLANLYDYGLLKPTNIIKLCDFLYSKINK